MAKVSKILRDSFGREHNYLRISLTEKCNLRCTYCMPESGVVLSPRSMLMTTEEVIYFATLFVKNGVDKIRLTGGEPLLRKDFGEILTVISKLPVELSLTTNAILVDRYIATFRSCGLKNINVSLDTLNAEKFDAITKRDHFSKAIQNIELLLQEDFNVKLNVVLMKNFNEDEIIDFINYTRDKNITVRFIEFMPFDGNAWDKSKLVGYDEVLNMAKAHYPEPDLVHLPNEKNFTARNFKIEGYQGSFGVISTVTNPFCDVCNRIRLTANGKLKNCLFSNGETDLLTAHRQGESIETIIHQAIQDKKAVRAGMAKEEDFKNMDNHNNRSMITIGG
ncbi:GTP 3',8-cyclase MoaA [Bacteroidia bacterium]|nr:GTP 3',8-cyclase MoaA [Bacteroidia bacterium]MDB9882188.1 GTP 3',8-cyclase MoaA [Bacteroidia bacterium]MDC1395378.1 GTP 3',8-cyclase MoaA [Bacteroidia bacterium]